MNEQYYENLLNIHTNGIQDLNETTTHYNRYEPTEYEALDFLFKDYQLQRTDSIIDFGSGKGRLNFYINHKFNCPVLGIEFNHYFYTKSLENKMTYLENFKVNPTDIDFINCLAEEYKIKPSQNKFYFFNPFSLQIFMKVLDNILDSFYSNERTIDIVLYYPSDDYIFFLDNCTLFNLFKEIKLPSFTNDNRERFLIYRLTPFN